MRVISQHTAFQMFANSQNQTVQLSKTESGEVRMTNIDPTSWFEYLSQNEILVMKTRTDILNILIHKYNLKSYLEIGVRDGNNFRKINCKDKTGVDPSLDFPGIENVVYTTSDSFFSTLSPEKKYDLIFIDGLHLEHQVTKDIENSLRHLTKNGFILMHDCNPPTVYHAREDANDLSTPARGKWNGTTWKAFVKARCTNKDIFACVIDLDWGCGLIHTMSKQKLYDVDDLDVCLEYEYLRKNRKQLLNLVSPDDFLAMYISEGV